MRRIGVLLNTPESDPEAKVELAAFAQELKKLGWSEGRNIQIDYRFGAGDIARMAMFAKELVAMKPDVIVARSTPVLKAVAAVTSTVPLVFIGVSDPVGEGLAANVDVRRTTHLPRQSGRNAPPRRSASPCRPRCSLALTR